MDQAMKVERSISSGPRRSTEQTCLGIAEFATEVLRDRGYPNVAGVRAGFEKVFPLLRFLLTTRGLGEPAVTMAMEDLEIDISVSYDPQFDEDLTPPNLVLLDSMTAANVIQISVHSTEEVAGRLGQLPAAASAEGIRFELTHGKRAADPLVDAAASDAADAADEPGAAEEPADEEPGAAEESADEPGAADARLGEEGTAPEAQQDVPANERVTAEEQVLPGPGSE